MPPIKDGENVTRDPTNPSNATVVAPEEKAVSRKVADRRGNVSAAAPAVGQVIDDLDLKVTVVGAKDQEPEPDTVTAGEGGAEGDLPLNDRGRTNAVTREGKRLWASDVPANPNDLLRNNNGTCDAVEF